MYGTAAKMPLTGESPICPASPYGRSQLTERALRNIAGAAVPWRALCLRYFNPVGADPWRNRMQTSAERKYLAWTAHRSLDDMCAEGWGGSRQFRTDIRAVGCERSTAAQR